MDRKDPHMSIYILPYVIGEDVDIGGEDFDGFVKVASATDLVMARTRLQQQEARKRVEELRPGFMLDVEIIKLRDPP